MSQNEYNSKEKATLTSLHHMCRRRSLPDQPKISLVSAILHEEWQHLRLELLQFSCGGAQAPTPACKLEQTQRSSLSAGRFQPKIRAYQTLISPAARQRLEKASHRHDELCQQLSGQQLPRALSICILCCVHRRRLLRQSRCLGRARVDRPEPKTGNHAPPRQHSHRADFHPSRRHLPIAPLWALPHKQRRGP